MIVTPVRAQHARSRRSRGTGRWRVSARNAGTAEATNCSPSPRPTISGHSLRAPTSSVGLVEAHRHERVVALELRVRRAHRLGEVALVGVGDQVRDHLGVGLRGEDAAVRRQPLLQRHVVLDDPVDDHVDAVAAVEVRVGVLLADAPVRRPARVTDAGRRRARCERDGAAGPARRLAVELRAAARSRLPTARTASIRSSAITEIPAES